MTSDVGYDGSTDVPDDVFDPELLEARAFATSMTTRPDWTIPRDWVCQHGSTKLGRLVRPSANCDQAGQTDCVWVESPTAATPTERTTT